MTTFQVHTPESAPEPSRALLADAKKAFGRIPNLIGVFAESPALLEAYLKLGQILEQSTAFDATERQVVLLATSFENNCEYCMAAHSAIADHQDVPGSVVQSLRNGTPIENRKLEALRAFTLAVVEKRGWVTGEDVQAFFAVGYTKRHLLEVILGVGFKTLSNFTNHIAETPVDRQFQKFEWSRPTSIAGD